MREMPQSSRSRADARRAPWTLEEFTVVEANDDVSDEELARLLKGRSSNAVGIVRYGLHFWRHEQDWRPAREMLPKVVREHLDKPGRAKVRCPRCGVWF